MRANIVCNLLTAAMIGGNLMADPEVSAIRRNNLLTHVFPPEIRTVACIAPASYPGSPSHQDGVQLLQKSGLQVKVMPHAFTRAPGKNAAALQDRLADFYAAWNDPEVDLIWCIRGGEGCEELLRHLDWSKLRKRPDLYLQGFSDVTLLLSALYHRAMGRPVAGPSVGTLPGLQQESIAAMQALYAGKTVGPVPVRTLIPGNCSGFPFAGLVERCCRIARSKERPDLRGRILFLESVGAPIPKLRKQLEELLERKFFDGVSGVVFCHFTRCGTPEEVERLLQEIAPRIGVPVYAGFPFGHESQSFAIDFARRAEICESAVTFPAVAK